MGKRIPTDQKIDLFTVGNDRELDLVLAKYDVLGSMAHAKMLQKINILTEKETTDLVTTLEEILVEIEKGDFTIEPTFEDVHSKIEYLLTEKLGDTGKKIHTARSRNDQVLVDIHLYLKDEISEIKKLTKDLFDLLISLSKNMKTFCFLVTRTCKLRCRLPLECGFLPMLKR